MNLQGKLVLEELFAWLVVSTVIKDVWKFAGMKSGVQYVMKHLMKLLPLLFVNNLVSPMKASNNLP